MHFISLYLFIYLSSSFYGKYQIEIVSDAQNWYPDEL